MHGVAEVRGVPDPCQRGPGGSAGRAIDLVLETGGQCLKARLRGFQNLVTDVVGRDGKAAVGGLVGDLRSEHAGAEHGDMDDVNGLLVVVRLGGHVVVLLWLG